MDDVIISLKNVFFSYDTMVKTSVREVLVKTLSRKPVNRSKGRVNALNDVSFDIKRGQNVGIVGSNGSGKSTLLRLLAGVYWQDAGQVDINTKKVSLMSLGTGFQDELSGIDNVYINGLLKGLSKAEIDNKLQSIIDFSELGDLVKNPIKTFSSGMISRLAFSISSVIEPDILLIDEILGVGDEKFREKSNARIRQLVTESQRTILLVTHNLPSLVELCDEAIWLEKGKIIQIGSPEEIIEVYKQSIKKVK